MNVVSFIDGHTATVALICDEKLEAFVSEERFTRKKCQMGYPRNAIDYCLKILGDRPLDLVIINGKNPPDPLSLRLARTHGFTIQDYIDEQYDFQKPILLDGEPKAAVYKKYLTKKIEEKGFIDIQYDGMNEAPWVNDPLLDSQIFRGIQIQTVMKHLKVEREKITFIEHHPAHAAYAYFASPFRGKDTLVFTMDGSGEGVNATISIAKNDTLTEVFRTSNANIGRLWKYITLILSMLPEQHEYKVMGLAPYANENYSLKVKKIFEDNFLHVDGLEFKFRTPPADIYFTFKKLLEGQRFDCIGGGLQLYTEKVVSEWFRNAIKKFGISRIVFSGGVAMNIKLNKAIAELPEIEEFYVAPSGGDEALALGVYYKHFGNGNTPHLDNIYLGSKFTKEQVLAAVAPFREKYVVRENVTESEVAQYLSKGYVIARSTGRMEFGARALGNRSILGDPSKIDVVKKINLQIKSRDFWMPFTPTILDTREHDYIVNPKKLSSPYMTMAFDSTELGKQHLPAAMHPYDCTIRPQILSESQNKGYYTLIKEFEKITGIGAVLDTSFNLHGEPVVCSPEDAMHTFNNSLLDMLYIEDVLVMRENYDK